MPHSGAQGWARVLGWCCVLVLAACDHRPLPLDVDEYEGEPETGALAAIRTLGPGDFPQRTEFVVEASTGWMPSRVQVSAGMPIRIWAEPVGDGTQSAWGHSGRAAGRRAPRPHAPDGVVLLRFAGRVYEVGSGDVFFAPSTASPEFAVNSPSREQAFAIELAWGPPTVEYELQLDELAIDVDAIEAQLDGFTVVGGRGWYQIADLPAGARMMLRTTQTGAYDAQDRGDDMEQPWRARYVAGPVDPIGMGYPVGSNLVRLGGEAGRVLPVVGDTWLHHIEGGPVEVSRVGGGRAEFAASLLPSLDTAVELLPWSAFTEVRDVGTLKFAGRRSVESNFAGTGLHVRSGDLIRVQSSGALTFEAGSGVARRLDDAERVALEPVQRPGAWLVPGGKKGALYLKISDTVIEVEADDTFYAPVTGALEYALNACSEPIGTGHPVGCQAVMQSASGRVHLSVGVVRGDPD